MRIARSRHYCEAKPRDWDQDRHLVRGLTGEVSSTVSPFTRSAPFGRQSVISRGKPCFSIEDTVTVPERKPFSSRPTLRTIRKYSNRTRGRTGAETGVIRSTADRRAYNGSRNRRDVSWGFFNQYAPTELSRYWLKKSKLEQSPMVRPVTSFPHRSRPRVRQRHTTVCVCEPIAFRVRVYGLRFTDYGLRFTDYGGRRQPVIVVERVLSRPHHLPWSSGIYYRSAGDRVPLISSRAVLTQTRWEFVC